MRPEDRQRAGFFLFAGATQFAILAITVTRVVAVVGRGLRRPVLAPLAETLEVCDDAVR